MPVTCRAPGCASTVIHARGLCRRHYNEWWRSSRHPLGPLWCECPEPAPPRTPIGECTTCHRIGLEVLAARLAHRRAEPTAPYLARL